MGYGISPHDAKRPWQGQNETVFNEVKPAYDPSCYLCAGNTRINGELNPNYNNVFVFTNDFAALQADPKNFNVEDGLLIALSEQGVCKVISFSSDHSKSLAEMKPKDIEIVVLGWQQEYKILAENLLVNYVQIFENKGAVMVCSNSYPHGQIWSQSSLPNEVYKKDLHQLEYYSKNKTILLGDYLEQELLKKERIIFENDAFVVLIPFWAVWHFEAMTAPKKQQSNILEIKNNESLLFVEAIPVLTKAYDRFFYISFPYSSGIHQSLTNGENNKHCRWHMSFYPPLLRSETIKKFMVGYEMFGSPQRNITDETAAYRLKYLVIKQHP